jgi:hypothetical protein
VQEKISRIRLRRSSTLGKGVIMRFSASSKPAASLLLLFVAGCAADAPLSVRINPNNQTAAGSGAASPGNGTAGVGTIDLTGNDNNKNSLIPTPPMGGMGGDGASGDGCVVGMFCAPTEPDPDNCGKLELKTTVKMIPKPGNVLVVYDRSTSMEQAWNGTPKYQAAGNALIAALTPLKDLLTVGAEFFPSLDPMAATNCPAGCNVADPLHWIPGPGACCLNAVGGDSCFISPITAADQIPFGPAAKFLSLLPMRWQFPMGGIGQTPLEGGVAEGAKALAATKLDGVTSVVIITDGEPNCMTNTTNVLNQVTKWHMAGIDTHVVGLPGAQGAAQLLDMLAQAGGTKTYIDPKDPKELETRLSSVLSSTVRQGFETCTFHLDPKADAPEKLHLLVKQGGVEMDVARDLSKDAHWKINAAGDQVDIEGQLCDLAKDGTFESLRFVFGCVDVPPLVPPPPPVIN